MRTSTWREWVYYHSPPTLQSLLFNAYAWTVERHRYGPDYRRVLQWLRARERVSPEEIRSYQNTRIREIVTFAAMNSPYYARKFQEWGVTPSDIRGVDDIQRIPVTTKEEVRRHWAEFLTSAPDRSWLPGATSGTTGTPLRLWYNRQTCLINNAVDRRNKEWAGADPDDWFGMFLGRVVINPDRTTPPFWRANHVQKQVWFSTFHLHPDFLPAMVKEIQRRKLRFLEGYPSTLWVLARFVLEGGSRLPMEAVITSSETLHDTQRADIEAAFECRLFDFYASAERVIFAAECEVHSGKHIIEEYGYVEAVDSDGKIVAPGEFGYLTGTTLHNTAMPLLRYRMGDLTRLDTGRCRCGRAGRVMGNVTTKAEDFITTHEGRVVSPSTLTHPFKTVAGITRSQIVQTAPSALTVRVVADPTFTPEEEQRLVDLLHDRVGSAMRITVVRDVDIPRELSGKFRWVISHVPLPGTGALLRRVE